MAANPDGSGGRCGVETTGDLGLSSSRGAVTARLRIPSSAALTMLAENARSGVVRAVETQGRSLGASSCSATGRLSPSRTRGPKPRSLKEDYHPPGWPGAAPRPKPENFSCRCSEQPRTSSCSSLDPRSTPCAALSVRSAPLNPGRSPGQVCGPPGVTAPAASTLRASPCWGPKPCPRCLLASSDLAEARTAAAKNPSSEFAAKTATPFEGLSGPKVCRAAEAALLALTSREAPPTR